MIVLMNKILRPAAAITPFLTSLIFTGSAFAAGAGTPVNTCDDTGTGIYKNLCSLASGDFGRVVGNGIIFVFVLAIILALGYLVWGAIKWITSEGDKGHVETARNQIVAAVVGLVIIALSWLILNLVLSFFFPGLNLTNLQLPSLF